MRKSDCIYYKGCLSAWAECEEKNYRAKIDFDCSGCQSYWQDKHELEFNRIPYLRLALAILRGIGPDKFNPWEDPPYNGYLLNCVDEVYSR